ncbi:hypothetical protein [Nitrososphaeria virus YSH_1032793]|uniref:Phage head morphogenesis domain-containing protein n=1 Tax=Nitrososphaeria virus YSH_1032793 TaxID=3071320 RepID=A0A976UB19_9CAUD|nr:hypothetical protein QKV91_gp38 [Yangshan Harbor Nitrososphaeria virus]UVF62242.1 hypothetical protein [Nitrososphaeria virus YSH_1032793]
MIKPKALKILSESLLDSKTSKTADHLIARYTVKLQKILEIISNENQPIEISRNKYGKRITRLYHELAQKTYLLTLNNVEDTSGIYPIITSKDIEEIKSRSINNSERFWNLLSQKKTEVKTESFSIFQILSFIHSSLAGMVYGDIQSISTQRNKILDTNLNFSEDSPIRERPFKMMWITEDDSRVCPICFPLHGRVYETTDEIPVIPNDTHPNCRCRVVPIDNDGNPLT